MCAGVRTSVTRLPSRPCVSSGRLGLSGIVDYTGRGGQSRRRCLGLGCSGSFMSEWGKGNLIKDRYRLLDKLGQGGMGSVWRAEHVELKAQVAVKLLDPAIAKNEEMVARFLREARASASLKSRHVVQVFDHGIQDGKAFMVMELLHGQTLGDRIERDGRMGAEQ